MGAKVGTRTLKWKRMGQSGNMKAKVGQEWEQGGTTMGTQLEQSGNKNPESATWGKLGTRTQKLDQEWGTKWEQRPKSEQDWEKMGQDWEQSGNKNGNKVGTRTRKWEKHREQSGNKNPKVGKE